MSAWAGKPCPCGRKKGPRQANLKWCATCQRERKKARSAGTHGKHVEKTYGITEAEYWEIYEAQGGKCAMCHHAYGRKKRLTVDHDHNCTEGHPRDVGCRKCVRGLLCVNCNRNVLGIAARDDPEFFLRGYEYLKSPPARKVLRR